MLHPDPLKLVIIDAPSMFNHAFFFDFLYKLDIVLPNTSIVMRISESNQSSSRKIMCPVKTSRVKKEKKKKNYSVTPFTNNLGIKQFFGSLKVS